MLKVLMTLILVLQVNSTTAEYVGTSLVDSSKYPANANKGKVSKCFLGMYQEMHS
ncbi:hypothetical protein [Paraglaciecola sp. 2405UD69-4]|uniref:hypothetical protein n=1 Tax=Paraglaciecola sp. 2405UD69-4 TaxID=3391836 RepID=UPI0039C9E4A0